MHTALTPPSVIRSATWERKSESATGKVLANRRYGRVQIALTIGYDSMPPYDPRVSKIAQLCLAIVVSMSMAAPSFAISKDNPWTSKDVQAAAKAAMESAAAAASSDTQASMLTQLADALIHSDNSALARTAILRAGPLLGPPTSFMSSATRGQVIEEFAELGDAVRAAGYLDVAAPPPTRAMLLGKLGAGRARAGDVAAAQEAVSAINAISDTAGAQPAVLANAKASAVAEIGLALDLARSGDITSKWALSLPDGLPKIRLLGQTARALCKAGAASVENLARGRSLAEQAATSARVAPTNPNMSFERTALVQFAAEALAACEGPDPALNFVRATVTGQQQFLALNTIADQFTTDGDTALATALAPAPRSDDAQSLLDSAMRFEKLGNLDTARTLAIQASSVALASTRESIPSNWYDHLAMCARLSAFLSELGLYDTAIASIQQYDPLNRRQYYINIVAGAARNRDASAVARLIPVAIDAVKAPSPNFDSIIKLEQLTRVLAIAGYQKAAQTTFEQLKLLQEDLTRPGTSYPAIIVTMAELQAAMGDLPEALATADRAGLLTTKPNPARAAIVAGMTLAGSPTRPNADEVKEALSRAQAAMPTVVPGPKAYALMGIATILATMGNINAARQAEAGLEGEPRDVLAPPHDNALEAIAETQKRSGDLEGSLATTLRMTQLLRRWKSLLALSAIPARQ